MVSNNIQRNADGDTYEPTGPGAPLPPPVRLGPGGDYTKDHHLGGPSCGGTAWAAHHGWLPGSDIDGPARWVAVPRAVWVLICVCYGLLAGGVVAVAWFADSVMR